MSNSPESSLIGFLRLSRRLLFSFFGVNDFGAACDLPTVDDWVGGLDVVFVVFVVLVGVLFFLQIQRDLRIGKHADTTAIDGSILVQIAASTRFHVISVRGVLARTITLAIDAAMTLSSIS